MAEWTYEVHELSDGISAIVYDAEALNHLTEARAKAIVDAANGTAAPAVADTDKTVGEPDTALIEAAREAGWALLENVDFMPFERRGQVRDISERLAQAIGQAETHSYLEDDTPPPADPALLASANRALKAQLDERDQEIAALRERLATPTAESKLRKAARQLAAELGANRPENFADVKDKDYVQLQVRVGAMRSLAAALRDAEGGVK